MDSQARSHDFLSRSFLGSFLGWLTPNGSSLSLLLPAHRNPRLRQETQMGRAPMAVGGSGAEVLLNLMDYGWIINNYSCEENSSYTFTTILFVCVLLMAWKETCPISQCVASGIKGNMQILLALLRGNIVFSCPT
jgi:hypothetical protein